MRSLSSAQGKGYKRRHYVPEDQHIALCGFMPSFGCTWRKALSKAHTCIDCHRILQRQTRSDA